MCLRARQPAASTRSLDPRGSIRLRRASNARASLVDKWERKALGTRSTLRCLEFAADTLQAHV
jgi:hypothetical protein